MTPFTSLDSLACCVQKLTDRVVALEVSNAALVTSNAALVTATQVLAPVSTVTLVAGAASVADTAVDANTIVLFARKTAGGTPGTLSHTVTNGVGVAFASSSATDTSVIAYSIQH